MFDIVVVGSGFVGSALACALRSLPLKIALLESAPRYPEKKDTRSIVLSYGSRLIFENLNLWSYLKTQTIPIHSIQLSDAGHFGVTHLSAKEENVDALGYVIEGGCLQKTLLNALDEIKTLHFMRPAKVISMMREESAWKLGLDCENTFSEIRGKLIIAADGTHSTIRQLQSVSVSEFDYHQTAVIANVDLSRTHHHVAYERFTKRGAIAFLPLSSMRSGVVWSAPEKLVPEMLSWSDTEFLKQLQKQFGFRLGKFLNVSARVAYPLKLTRVDKQSGPGWVLVGNAAHTLHPIAAQGFNLGLRDVARLADVIETAVNQHSDLQDEALLQKYVVQRKRDQQRTIQFTHQLVRFFSYDFVPLNVVRNLATSMIEYLPFLKHRLAKRAMGLVH